MRRWGGVAGDAGAAGELIRLTPHPSPLTPHALPLTSVGFEVGTCLNAMVKERGQKRGLSPIIRTMQRRGLRRFWESIFNPKIESVKFRNAGYSD